MLVQRLAAGLATAAVAHAATMLVLAGGSLRLNPSLYWSHFLVVLAFQLAAALLLAGWRDNRPWAAAVFVFPVAAALRPLAALHAGVFGELAVIAAAGIAVLAWVRFARGPGAPLAAAALGSAAGSALCRTHIYAPRFGETAPVPLLVVGAAAAVACLCAIRAGRLRSLAQTPGLAASAIASAGALLLSGAALLMVQLSSPWLAPPPSTTEAREADRPPLVLVVLDTVRADHLELYGYHRETMPALAKFARSEGVRVHRSVANSATSLTTHASLFTGLYPPRHGAHHAFIDDPDAILSGYPLRPDAPTLAALLSQAGYWTAGVAANFGPLAPGKGLERGFDFYDATPSTLMRMRERSPWAELATAHERIEFLRGRLDAIYPFSGDAFFQGAPYRRAGEITDRAVEILDAAASRPLFLFLNYFDAHTPYFPPPAYRDRFPGRNSALGLKGIDNAPELEVMRGKRALSANEYAHLTALYDGELAYLDSQLDRLFEHLRRHPRWDEMLVIVTSDHGEAFGEHNRLRHSRSLYEEELHVPLIVKLGRSPAVAGQRSALETAIGSGMFQSVDVFASILAYAGVQPPPDIDGVAWGRGREHALSWLYLFENFVERFGPEFRRELRSVESRNWKLIHSSTGDIEVYDLANDPDEIRAVDDFATDRREAMLQALDAVTVFDAAEADGGTELSPEALERLRGLGYIQ
jgi:arylsulfatase A-like enzyme